MFKFLPTYNRNKRILVAIIIVIASILIGLQILNYFAKQNLEKKNEEAMKDTIYGNFIQDPSESMVSEGNVPKEYEDDFNSLIDNFLKACQQGKVQEAYTYLSKECKEVLYPDITDFQKGYYNYNFGDDKTYSFQSWSTGTRYIYKIKIMDNILATGIDTSERYIEDYVTIVKQNNEYKLNISGFIGQKEYKTKQQKENIEIEIDKIDVFMDYEIYHLNVKNSSDKTIMLDTLNKTNTTYIVDENNVKYTSFLTELPKNKLIIKPDETKNIEIKFNDSFRQELEIEKLVFSDVIKDYQKYIENQITDDDRIQIEIAV